MCIAGGLGVVPSDWLPGARVDDDLPAGKVVVLALEEAAAQRGRDVPANDRAEVAERSDVVRRRCLERDKLQAWGMRETFQDVGRIEVQVLQVRKESGKMVRKTLVGVRVPLLVVADTAGIFIDMQVDDGREMDAGGFIVVNMNIWPDHIEVSQ